MTSATTARIAIIRIIYGNIDELLSCCISSSISVFSVEEASEVAAEAVATLPPVTIAFPSLVLAVAGFPEAADP